MLFFLGVTVPALCLPVFFFNDTATTEIYTLSLHDALPILTLSQGIISVLSSVRCGKSMLQYLSDEGS